LQAVFFDHSPERARGADDIFLAYEFIERARPHAIRERARAWRRGWRRRIFFLFKQPACARARGLNGGFLESWHSGLLKK
jgi:hypothetical protein